MTGIEAGRLAVTISRDPRFSATTFRSVGQHVGVRVKNLRNGVSTNIHSFAAWKRYQRVHDTEDAIAAEDGKE